MRSFGERGSSEIQQYEKDYTAEFRKPFRESNKQELLDKISTVPLVFCGDFHPLPQSQRTALRLLRELVEKSADWTLGLECVHHRFQKHLDAFVRRDITLSELREDIHFDDYWPFPWDNYRELFELSRKSPLRLLALNSGSADGRASLQERDLAAAQIIASFFQQNKSARIFVLFGDLHITRKHLPKTTREILWSNELKYNSVVIFQNEPTIYWRLAESDQEHRVDVVQLKPDAWCVMSATPWVRTHAHLAWLEGSDDEEAEGEAENTERLATKISQHAEWIQNSLILEQTKIPSFAILLSDQIEQLENFARTDSKNRLKLKWIRALLFRSRSFYLPEKSLLYLPSTSINALAEAAVLVLLRNSWEVEESLDEGRPHEAILQSLFSYLGSKFVNPKRKCENIADLTTKHSALARKRSTRQRARRVILQQTLLVIKQLKANKPKITKLPSTLGLGAKLEICRIAGNLMGERIFFALQENQISLKQVSSYFQSFSEKSISSEDLLDEICREMAKVPFPFLSKDEKI